MAIERAMVLLSSRVASGTLRSFLASASATGSSALWPRDRGFRET
jgi:hypothetical protein